MSPLDWHQSINFDGVRFRDDFFYVHWVNINSHWRQKMMNKRSSIGQVVNLTMLFLYHLTWIVFKTFPNKMWSNIIFVWYVYFSMYTFLAKWPNIFGCGRLVLKNQGHRLLQVHCSPIYRKWKQKIGIVCQKLITRTAQNHCSYFSASHCWKIFTTNGWCFRLYLSNKQQKRG
jgi:hypothetical protein